MKTLWLSLICIILLPLCGSAQAEIETTYDSAQDKTTVRLKPVLITGNQEQYHSVHIAPAFSFPGKKFKKPRFVDFEVQTVVTAKLKIDLYVVFLVDDDTIFLSSNRWAVKKTVAGKRWVGERLVFRMPYDTLMKITKAKSVIIKMDDVRFPLSEERMQDLRRFAQQLEPQS